MTICIDFETQPIGPRPGHYPPEPVGLAVRFPNGRKDYIAWGHPDSAPEMASAARSLLKDVFAGQYGTVVMHNASFDLEVAAKFLGRPEIVGYEDFRDTMFEAFLVDPRMSDMELKPMSERLLGMPPGERDLMHEWLMQNGSKEVRQAIRQTKKRASKYVALVPEKIAGAYAKGDVDRTHRLHKYFTREIKAARMEEPYRLERDLLPVTVKMEQGGVRIDRPGLSAMRSALEKIVASRDKAICRRLGRTFNVGSGPQLAEALTLSGVLSEVRLTATGKQSTARQTLLDTCTDKVVLNHLLIRELADKYLGTFVGPWLEKADGDDYIHPSFHQTRGTDEDFKGGTRTGRYSSSDPNFQQVPTGGDEAKNADGIKLLSAELAKFGVHGFTGLRNFILPDPGMIIAPIDYSQQELRFLAHFVGGSLAAAYRKNPDMDIHGWFRDEIRAATGVDYPRKHVKTVVFGILYGMGLNKLAAALGITREEAHALRSSLYTVVPTLRKFADLCAEEGDSASGMYTWGGRRYFTQDAVINEFTNDVEREYGYKQLNIKIQGSSADLTKRAMLKIHRAGVGRLALQVHDEVVCMVRNAAEAKYIAELMCSFQLDVPLRAGITMSDKSWGDAR